MGLGVLQAVPDGFVAHFNKLRNPLEKYTEKQLPASPHSSANLRKRCANGVRVLQRLLNLKA